MEMEITGNKYVKRTQRDYSMPFKLAIVQEVERTGIGVCAIARKYGIQSESTVTAWLRKYGNFDISNKTHQTMEQSKEQKLMELEERVRFLERQNSRLQDELEKKDHKVAFFDMMIDMAEKEFKIDIKKNYSAEQSNNTKKKKECQL